MSDTTDQGTPQPPNTAAGAPEPKAPTNDQAKDPDREFYRGLGIGMDKAKREFARELGFESPEDAAKAIEERKKQEEERAKEQGQYKQLLDERERENGELKSRLQATEQRARSALVKSAFVAAVAGKVVSPDDLFRLADTSGVEIDDDGNVIGIEDVVEQTLKDRPHFLKQPGTTSAVGAATNPAAGPPPEDFDWTKATPEQVAAQRRQMGLPN